MRLTSPSFYSRASLSLGLGLLLRLATSGLGAAENDVAPERPTLHRLSEFYDLPSHERLQERQVEFEITISYHDPVWNLLWFEQQGAPFFQALAAPLPHLKPGQRVRLRGSISQEGLRADPSKLETLEEAGGLVYTPANGRLDQPLALNGKAVSLDLYIDAQTEVDTRHLLLNGLAEGKRIQVRVLKEADEIHPLFSAGFVRARGVFVESSDTAGKHVTRELWVSAPSDLQLIGSLATDPRFKREATPIAELRARPDPGALVRVLGHVHRHIPGSVLLLRDATGEIEVRSAQTIALEEGDQAEAIGTAVLDGIHLRLEDALFRSLGPAAGNGDEGLGLPVLRLVDQARKLDRASVQKSHPVRLHTVVTWSHPDADFIFVEDSTGGLRVRLGKIPVPPALSLIDLHGTVTFTPEGPEIKATEIIRHASIQPANPGQLSLEQARTGLRDCQLVEITGFVRMIRNQGGWLRAEMSTPNGEFSIILPSNINIDRLHGSVVNARGVCTRRLDAKGRLSGVELWALTASDLILVGPRPERPFSLPLTPISSIDASRSFISEAPWVHLAGVATYHIPGRYLIIQDGDEAIMVLSRSEIPLKPGDSVEVVGLPGMEQGRVVLRDALVRKGVAPRQAATLAPNPKRTVDPEADCRLVRLEGELLERSWNAGGLVLIMKGDQGLFEGRLARSAFEEASVPWSKGSKLSLRGIYVVQRDEYQDPKGFHLDLRAADDIVVLEAAPWWTPRRAVVSLSIMGMIAFGAAAWITLLRRQVKTQTEIIRTQMEREARLNTEIERSARLESLGNLAGGIAHDFNNILTIIIANLSLMRMDQESITGEMATRLEEAEKGARRARSLTQQLLTFARGGNPVRKPHQVAALLSESLSRHVEGTNVTHLLQAPAGLLPALVDREQMLHVFRHLFVNAIQAMPNGGHLCVSASNIELQRDNEEGLQEGHYVKVSVSDTGPGISQEYLGRVFDPYYSTKGSHQGLGLATVRSILKKHGGNIEVSSPVGKGCCFTVLLPAVRELPPAPVEAVPDRKPPPAKAKILFMDDETAIQRLAGELFRKLGLEHDLASDGAEALALFKKAHLAGKSYDLVITDLTVDRGMGGAELMRELVLVHPGVRALVSSGYSNDPILSRYQDYGFVGCVTKPYEIDELQKAVEEALTKQPPRGGRGGA